MCSATLGAYTIASPFQLQAWSHSPMATSPSAGAIPRMAQEEAHDSGRRRVLRRFLLHVLPPGFVRIRHFGFLANRNRATLLPLCFQLLGGSEEKTASAAEPSVDRLTLFGTVRSAAEPCTSSNGLSAAQLLLRSPTSTRSVRRMNRCQHPTAFARVRRESSFLAHPPKLLCRQPLQRTS